MRIPRKFQDMLVFVLPALLDSRICLDLQVQLRLEIQAFHACTKRHALQ
jgi:hypothetical protein